MQGIVPARKGTDSKLRITREEDTVSGTRKTRFAALKGSTVEMEYSPSDLQAVWYNLSTIRLRGLALDIIMRYNIIINTYSIRCCTIITRLIKLFPCKLRALFLDKSKSNKIWISSALICFESCIYVHLLTLMAVTAEFGSFSFTFCQVNFRRFEVLSLSKRLEQHE